MADEAEELAEQLSLIQDNESSDIEEVNNSLLVPLTLDLFPQQ